MLDDIWTFILPSDPPQKAKNLLKLKAILYIMVVFKNSGFGDRALTLTCGSPIYQLHHCISFLWLL